jgi:hypothetical protein
LRIDQNADEIHGRMDRHFEIVKFTERPRRMQVLNSLAACLALATCVGCAAPRETVVLAPVDASPQNDPAEFERSPGHITDCIATLEIAMRREPGTPPIGDAAAEIARWRGVFQEVTPDEAARTSALATARAEWAELLAAKTLAEREMWLFEMTTICGAQAPGDYAPPH